MSSNYKAGQIREVAELKEVIERVNNEFRLLESAFDQPVRLPTLSAEPEKPRDGTVAYADGVAWDPGEGEGIYTYFNGQWNKALSGDYQLQDDMLDDISALTDPGVDSGIFWDESSNQLDFFTPTLGLEFNGLNLRMTANQRLVGLPFVIYGGAATLQAGLYGGFRVPFACTITGVSMGADATTTTVVDIWKDTQTNFPPVNADSITASANPTITASNKMEDNTLTGWTTSITAGDWLFFNLDSNTAAKWLSINLKATKT
jgi:hypothetical protein